jgi:hypothetical protein
MVVEVYAAQESPPPGIIEKPQPRGIAQGSPDLQSRIVVEHVEYSMPEHASDA